MMTSTTFQLHISDREYRTRCDRLLNYLIDQNLSGVVLFDRDYLLYYTGFAFIPTERPIAFVMNRNGERGMLVPRLELEHAKANALIENVAHYVEYPDDPHPMSVLLDLMTDMGVTGHIGSDHDGYPPIFGYRGTRFTEMRDIHLHYVNNVVEDHMMIKSPAELALIQESCRWGNLAHTLLQRYTRVGVTETEVTQRASNEATLAMVDAIGPVYRSQGIFFDNASAGYRGQIGRNAAIPHALANNLTFQEGDTLVTGAGASVWGYNSELERTMFIGTPTDEQKYFFDHMFNLQTLAIEAIEPGKPCREVDLEVRAYFQQHDLFQYWKHHVGHTIGIRYHEGPFLDKGDSTIIQPGMVFTVEPGLYSAEWGGFRHSDTVAVTEDGTEMMTYYPRDLESLIIPT